MWQSLRNLETALKVAGGRLQDVVSLRIYIVEAYLGQSKPVSDGLRAFFPGDTPPTCWPIDFIFAALYNFRCL